MEATALNCGIYRPQRRASQHGLTETSENSHNFYVAAQHDRTMLMGDRGMQGARFPMKRHWARLDQIAGEMNAWLLVIAIGLGMLDLVVLVAKIMPAVPAPRSTPNAGSREHAVLLSPT